MSDLPEPRIADVDRDRVSAILRAAYGEGRISEAELEERLASVYSARVASELAVVTADLPVSQGTPPQPVALPQRGSYDLRPAVPLLLPAVVCTLIYVMTMPGGYFWPMWVWLGCGVPAFLAVFAGGRGRESPEPRSTPPQGPPEVTP